MKRRIFAYLVVFAVTSLLIPSAWAAWGSFKSLGKTPTVGEPSCAQLAGKEVVCATRSLNHTLMVNLFSNSAWAGWTDLAIGVGSDPSCIADHAGNIVCGVVSASSTLAAVVFDGTTWSSLVDSGGQISSAPSCAFFKNGKVFCAARGPSGSLTASILSSGKWGKFINAKASLTSAPSCASDNDNDVICTMIAIVTATNNTVITNRFNGSKWDGFLTLQANISGDPPICTALGGVKGQVMCFVRASNTAIYRNMFKSGIWQNSNWTNWGAITGGLVGPRISCGQPTAGTLACGVRYLGDSFMYTGTFDGTNWSSFNTKVGTKQILGSPSCTEFSGGVFLCATVGLNTQVSSTTGP